MKVMSKEANLDEIAAQELLNEAKRGAARASMQGALGWQKCPLPRTNKRFLGNMLINNLHANRVKKEKMKSSGAVDKEPGDRCRSPLSNKKHKYGQEGTNDSVDSKDKPRNDLVSLNNSGPSRPNHVSKESHSTRCDKRSYSECDRKKTKDNKADK